MWVLSAVATFLGMLCPVVGHGRLMDPPARNSMWRLGFPNPVNYNDNELYCGGRVTQWARNKGKCGVCGDPHHHVQKDHEVGGKYANGIISREYVQGDAIGVTVHVTANHKGFFEFRICPVENPAVEVNQECLDKHVMKVTNEEGSRYYLPEGKSNQFFNVTIELPEDVTCKQCVIQWKYITANTWDKDDSGKYCVGCGPQEEFYNCADVTIHPRNGQVKGHTTGKVTALKRKEPTVKEKAMKFEDIVFTNVNDDGKGLNHQTISEYGKQKVELINKVGSDQYSLWSAPEVKSIPKSPFAHLARKDGAASERRMRSGKTYSTEKHADPSAETTTNQPAGVAYRWKSGSVNNKNFVNTRRWFSSSSPTSSNEKNNDLPKKKQEELQGNNKSAVTKSRHAIKETIKDERNKLSTPPYQRTRKTNLYSARRTTSRGDLGRTNVTSTLASYSKYPTKTVANIQDALRNLMREKKTTPQQQDNFLRRWKIMTLKHTATLEATQSVKDSTDQKPSHQTTAPTTEKSKNQFTKGVRNFQRRKSVPLPHSSKPSDVTRGLVQQRDHQSIFSPATTVTTVTRGTKPKSSQQKYQKKRLPSWLVTALKLTFMETENDDHLSKSDEHKDSGVDIDSSSVVAAQDDDALRPKKMQHDVDSRGRGISKLPTLSTDTGSIYTTQRVPPHRDINHNTQRVQSHTDNHSTQRVQSHTDINHNTQRVQPHPDINHSTQRVQPHPDISHSTQRVQPHPDISLSTQRVPQHTDISLNTQRQKSPSRRKATNNKTSRQDNDYKLLEKTRSLSNENLPPSVKSTTDVDKSTDTSSNNNESSDSKDTESLVRYIVKLLLTQKENGGRSQNMEKSDTSSDISEDISSQMTEPMMRAFKDNAGAARFLQGSKKRFNNKNMVINNRESTEHMNEREDTKKITSVNNPSDLLQNSKRQKKTRSYVRPDVLPFAGVISNSGAGRELTGSNLSSYRGRKTTRPILNLDTSKVQENPYVNNNNYVKQSQPGTTQVSKQYHEEFLQERNPQSEWQPEHDNSFLVQSSNDRREVTGSNLNTYRDRLTTRPVFKMDTSKVQRNSYVNNKNYVKQNHPVTTQSSIQYHNEFLQDRKPESTWQPEQENPFLVQSSPDGHHLWSGRVTARQAHYTRQHGSTKPQLVCESLVVLSGGMDRWCTDNCNANFCPPTMCVCSTKVIPSSQPYASFPRRSDYPYGAYPRRRIGHFTRDIETEDTHNRRIFNQEINDVTKLESSQRNDNALLPEYSSTNNERQYFEPKMSLPTHAPSTKVQFSLTFSHGTNRENIHLFPDSSGNIHQDSNRGIQSLHMKNTNMDRSRNNEPLYAWYSRNVIGDRPAPGNAVAHNSMERHFGSYHRNEKHFQSPPITNSGFENRSNRYHYTSVV